MSDPVPPMTVTLEWDSALEFTAQAGKHAIGIDGNTYAAPSPMQLMAIAIAGCMAVDVVAILTKGRHTVRSLAATFTGQRANTNPKRFTGIGLDFAIATDAKPEHVERALQLSRDTYCSAWNTLREDVELKVNYTIEGLK